MWKVGCFKVFSGSKGSVLATAWCPLEDSLGQIYLRLHASTAAVLHGSVVCTSGSHPAPDHVLYLWLQAGVTHTNPTGKSSVTVDWEAPAAGTGCIRFA